ncbi:MAG: ATP-binding cassette domain-containing protein [Bacteriovoracaceae bacterium]|nr:ATP-binding cassette domain-containing protein [Bacteriovoracaceae bacterium]
MKLNFDVLHMRPSFVSHGMYLELGRCHGIWGENGIGKTRYLTFLKQLQLINPRPTSRFWAFLDQAPYENYYDCTVFDLAEELFSLSHLPWKQKPKEQFLSILHQLNQQNMLHENYKRLSGGQRQILKWALILVQEFDFLFLDEPFQQLDEAKRDWACEQIQLQKQQGKGIALVDHNWPRLEVLCEQIFELKKIETTDEKLTFILKERKN